MLTLLMLVTYTQGIMHVNVLMLSNSALLYLYIDHDKYVAVFIRRQIDLFDPPCLINKTLLNYLS